QDRPSSDTQYALITLKCGTETIPVDVSANRSVLDDISIDSVFEVTGTCIVECENWHSYSAFPHVTGITLVARKPSDIRILKRPPWWTPRKLMIVIGGLLAVILGIIVRNKLQKRKAAMLAKFSTELKVEERTRLAVELHDSLAQNLTGVSLEIDTAGKLAETDPKAMREHLGQATRTLKSCRDELRNCIWDLRNRALEESSMDEAIRQTLAPHVIGVDVAIRFNVPRERISDNTAHAILRSIRELAINAVRHGRATKIWIAGSIDGDNLLFSVRDNGTGFDPATAPGFAEGHYGLVGITERIEALEGEFNIESSPGSGAKATARISARRETLDTRRDVLPTNASPSSHV
ncbi:MAG: sensor histidine kinase, partial [Kiritimatiellae bacterium]|nr:sensor histidine kinase [Kiritimatiellia bacterium]